MSDETKTVSQSPEERLPHEQSVAPEQGKDSPPMENDQSDEAARTSTSAIGRTSATQHEAITSEKFAFWLPSGVIVNPFDIVAVDQVSQKESGSRTYGLVTILGHTTDATSHLANYISSNFGQLTEKPNTARQGTTVAAVNVLSNNDDIYMPVPSDQIVHFADQPGIEQAFGIDTLLTERPTDAIPAGLIQMSNGTDVPIYLDQRYVLGPEAGHINISGISGLATKTSYAMFLLQAILQKAPERSQVAVIVLNVKQGDLLRIDQAPTEALSDEQKAPWIALNLEPKPFDNVSYLLPRDRNGQANSFITPSQYTIYAYELPGTADKLDVLFTNVADPANTMESIIGDIMQGLSDSGGAFSNVLSWDQLLHGPPLSKNSKSQNFGDNKANSVGKFRRQLRRIVQTRQTGIFVDSRAGEEKRLSDEIRDIQGGRTYVVDIARLRDEEQTLVFGDILRTIYDLKAEDGEGRSKEAGPVPSKIIIFVDELNKYAPASGKESAITQQVLEVAERGRSLGVILVSAQQFMSAVHPRVTGNSATKIIGRTGSSEINAPDYRFLDTDIRSAVTRLNKGELLVSHAIYRQPVKVRFPRPAYRQEQ